MPRTLFSDTFDTFRGLGLAPVPAPGQLDSDIWSVTGFSAGDVAFGDTSAGTDFTRGVTAGGVSSGGLYALDQGGEDYALMVQPSGSDFTPGALTLKVTNDGADASAVSVSFDLLINNDQTRANSFDLSYSLDGGVTFTGLTSAVSDELSDAGGFQRTSFSAVLPETLTAGSDLLLRWSSDDVSGGGSRDEFAIDNVVVGDDLISPPAPTFVQSFEDAPGTDYTLTGAFDDGGFDFFGRFDAPDGSNGARDDFTDGFDGNFAIYGQDIDGDGGPSTGIITIPDIDLTGYSDPGVTIALGALNSEPSFQNYEAADGDGIRIFATLDGGARVQIGAFLPPEGGAGDLRQDTNGDGIGDGDPLTTRLTDFRFDLPEGNLLTLEIEVTSTDSFEPIAVDNVRVGDGDTGGGGGDGGVTIDDEATLISTVQGSGSASALVGQTVVVEAIMTGDFQDGDGDGFRNLGGFFVMEEAADFDADAATSEGLFIRDVDLPGAPDVAAGDTVRVLGTVVERFGKTTIEATEIRIEETGTVEDVMSLAVETSLPGVDDREALESMLIDVTEPLTFSESFDYENFGEATFTSGGQVYQYTQLNDPDAAGNAAYAEEVADRSIIVDDGTNGSRADGSPILQPDGTPFDIDAPIRMGDDFDLTGILDFDFGAFRLRLPEGAAFEPIEEVEIPTEPADVGGSLQVGSLNVLNYFTTLDQNGNQTDIGLGPRGAESAEELARQTDKLVTTILGMDADVIGLVELENNFAGDNFAIQTLVDAVNASLGDDVWDFVDPGQEFVGTDAIAVGMIYNTQTVELVGTAAILDDQSFLDPLDDGDDSNGDETPNGDSFNRAAVAQTFREIDGGGEFTAVVNHYKSKGSLTGAEADDDQGDGAGRNDATREAASEALLDWLATDPTGAGDDDVLILGDLNAYAREDPITVLEDGGFTNLVAAFEGLESTSYRFSGEVGTLDYALSSDSLTSQVTGATAWDVNDESPVFFDYNLDPTFGGPDRPDPADQNLFDGDSPLRGSDHDPIIVGLDLDPEAIVIAGDEGRDRLRGTEADEILIGGGGFDSVAGRGGADTFEFVDVAGRYDLLVIRDYDADDVLDMNGVGIARTLDVGRNTVLITDTWDTIVLRRTNPEDIVFDDLPLV
ncbi:MAG: ExeM/NucH family extracellular endonuclease [Pseudomonadota bacterium]